MKVVLRIVGVIGLAYDHWPEGWPIPRVDDEINLDDHNLYVRHVIWYPKGEEEDAEPFVYVVCGPSRPR